MPSCSSPAPTNRRGSWRWDSNPDEFSAGRRLGAASLAMVASERGEVVNPPGPAGGAPQLDPLQGRQPIMRRIRALVFTLALFVPGIHGRAACSAPAVPGGARGVMLTGLRPWTAPADTRVVLEFSGSVSPVAPDSGRARELIVAFPGESLPRAANVPASLGVHDGVVDSVEVISTSQGSRVRIAFRDSVRFRVAS